MCVLRHDISSEITLTSDHNIQQFNETLRVLFQPSSIQSTLLRRYVDLGAYELAIDNGKQTVEITDQNAWSRIECGMTIVMNITVVRMAYKDWRKCPVCRARNYPRDNSEKFTIDWYNMMLLIDDVHLSVDSSNCHRRLQGDHSIENSINGTEVADDYEKDFEFIRNIRIYRRVGSLK